MKGINVHLAKKMIEDRSRDYMNARRVAKVSSAQVELHKATGPVIMLVLNAFLGCK